MAKAATVKINIDRAKLDQIMKASQRGARRRIIADGTNYGVFVCLGTSKMSARPYLVPAFERNTKDLPDALGQAVERGISLDDVIGKVAFDVQGDAQKMVAVDTGNLKNSLHVDTE